jgi:hypothetical protein
MQELELPRGTKGKSYHITQYLELLNILHMDRISYFESPPTSQGQLCHH